MPSSTSNSNERLRDAAWGRIWAGALALAVLFVATAEIYWRVNGIVPSFSDTPVSWTLARRSVSRPDFDGVVLIGSSRILAGLDGKAFAEVYGGRRPVQLGINGADGRPILRRLANDPAFRGTVVCDVLPHLFFAENAPADADSGTESREPAPSTLSLVEHHLRLLVQKGFVFRVPDVAPKRVLESLIRRGRLPVQWRIGNFDRSESLDFSKLGGGDLADLERSFVRRRESVHGVPAQQMLQDLEAIDDMVSQIELRGGRVAFVRFPASGAVLATEERVFPRAASWDELVKHTRAISIHFTDYPALSGFRCPDGSHLDRQEAVEFSRALAWILKDSLQRQ